MLEARLTSQLLAGRPARSAVDVVERLLAIQGQDPRGFRLAIRARSRGLAATDVDRALTEERSLVVTWLNRGTLHLVRSEDYPWLHALTTPQLRTSIMRRLAQEGAEPKGVRKIERALAADGALTRAQLADRVGQKGLLQLLALASLEGLIVRGPVIGKQHAYVLVRDWLPRPPRFDRDTALAELGRRFLAGHAPADERDLAYWAGIPLRDARAGLAAIRAPRARRAARLPPPRLLGSFDPVLHGWASREWILRKHDPLVVTGGVFRPFALTEGRAVARWKLERSRVVLEPLERLSAAVRKALEEDAADVERFAGASASRARRQSAGSSGNGPI